MESLTYLQQNANDRESNGLKFIRNLKVAAGNLCNSLSVIASFLQILFRKDVFPTLSSNPRVFTIQVDFGGS